MTPEDPPRDNSKINDLDLWVQIARDALSRGIDRLVDPIEQDWKGVSILGYASEFGRKYDIPFTPALQHRTFLRLERNGVQTHTMCRDKPSSPEYLIDYAKDVLSFPSHLFNPFEAALREFESLDPHRKSAWEAEIERYARLTNSEMVSPQNWLYGSGRPTSYHLHLLRRNEWMKRKLDSLRANN